MILDIRYYMIMREEEKENKKKKEKSEIGVRCSNNTVV